jgi:hypothetical protein
MLPDLILIPAGSFVGHPARTGRRRINSIGAFKIAKPGHQCRVCGIRRRGGYQNEKP